MFPANIEAVISVLLAVVPGFITTTIWARARTWKGPAGDLRTILHSLVLSVVIQALVLPLTFTWIYPVRDRLDEFPERLGVWLFLVVLVVPLLVGAVSGRLTDYFADPSHSRVEGRFRRAIARLWPAPAPPSIWDWFFTVRPPNERFLVITFRDGSRVAGAFAEESLALTSPEPHGLFLSSEWLLDEYGDIVRPVESSEGIMIMDTESIRHIRVLRGEE
jgi:hypothetical protein